jgi:ABC-type oligopeptide transport system substrate-binding subunit
MRAGWHRTVGLGLAVLVVAIGCGQGGDQPLSDRLAGDQTLRFAIAQDVGTLDPAQTYASADLQVAQNLFDGVVRYDDALNVVPDLGAALPTVSADQLTYTFRLRPGATFSNGDRLTSRDVLYSWNRAAAEEGPYAATFSAVAGFDRLPAQPPAPAVLEQLLARNDPSVRLNGLTAPDDATVVVKLAHPAGWFLSALALPGAVGMVVDQRVIQQDPAGWWTKPATLVGSGPYRLSGRTSGESLDFAAVPDWWGDTPPTVRTVHVDVVADATEREAAYEQGQYYVNGFGGSNTLSPSDLTRIEATPSLAAELLTRPGTGSAWVSFNMVHDAIRGAGGPFLASLGQAALDLRLAFSLALDRSRLSAACGALCSPATGGLIPRGLAGYGGDGSDPLARFDPAGARTLLRGADPDGSRTRGLVFVYDTESPLYRALAESLRAQWSANLGVQVQLQPEAHQQLLRDERAGKLVLSRAGWQADYDDPADWYDNNFGRAAGCPDSNCGSGYDSAAFDQVAAQADTKPLAAALPLYERLAEMLSADAAYVPLVYSTRMYMIKPYVRGAGANNLLEYPWADYRILQHS